MKKKLSIFIVPDSGNVKQFSLSKSLLIGLATVTFLYCGASLVFSIDFFSRKVEAHRYKSMSEENRFLNAKLASINTSIGKLSDEVKGLVEKEKAIRTIFELPEIDPQQRELGIGGPDGIPSTNGSSPIRDAAFQSEAEIDRLVALSSFEKEQFNYIYQRLLEKKSDLDHTPSIMPTQGYLIRGYGVKSDPFTGERKLHSGMDISNRIGTPVVVTANGVVASTRYQSGLGNTVIVDHGSGMQTVYGHLSQFKTKEGQRVRRGELIGLVGNTGYSTGPHLHYEVIKLGGTVNPVQYIFASGLEF
jgi:murein DD-endopeptidase MepM/ murein hydrolase activator NlpD